MKFSIPLPHIDTSSHFWIYFEIPNIFREKKIAVFALGILNFSAISTILLFRLLINFVAQWNFIDSFISLIPRNVFRFISKFPIFFEKLKLVLKLFAIGIVHSFVKLGTSHQRHPLFLDLFPKPIYFSNSSSFPISRRYTFFRVRYYCIFCYLND